MTAHPIAAGAVILLILSLAYFNTLLISPGSVISEAGQDMWKGEVAGRIFLRPEMRHGHIPMWLPWIMSGTPCFTKSQVPLLYPFEWFGLLFPVGIAINLNLAIHIFLTGFWMFLWARHRGMTFLGAITSGILLMFSGPVMLHLYAGHLNNITAMSWVPLMFMAVDMLIEGRYGPGIRWGVFALAMQIFASQPQYTLFSLIALAIYALASLRRARQPGAVLGAGALTFILGIAIGAVSLLPAALQAQESTRSHGAMSAAYAQSFSISPVSLLTLIMPSFYGGNASSYWGPWNLWETSIFIGVFGALLAAAGALLTKAIGRKTIVFMTCLMLVFAIGKSSTLYSILYHYLPGFSMIRGTSKFIYEAAIFLALLAGMGMDALRKRSAAVRSLSLLAGGGCVICLVVMTWLNAPQHRAKIGAKIAHMHSHGAVTAEDVERATTVNVSSAVHALAEASFTFGIAGVLLLATWRKPERRWLVAGACAAEMFCFAFSVRTSFKITDLIPNSLIETASRLGHDGGRIALRPNANLAMALGVSTVDGYDSVRLKRYAEFIAYTQGQDPSKYEAVSTEYVRNPGPMLRLLRLQGVLDRTDKRIFPVPGSLPHVFLAEQAIIESHRDAEFATMSSGGFQPERQVVLETRPDPFPMSDNNIASGEAVITDSGTDFLDIQADAARPVVLVVTDSYSRNWQALALPGSSQSRYTVMPADYTLRGIPLGAGHHAIHLQYYAPGWRIAESITFAAFIACAVLQITILRDSRQKLHFKRKK